MSVDDRGPVRPGRPMKYRPFLLALEDDELYSPATIAHFGETKGFFHAGRGIFPWTMEGEELKEAKLRIRHTLARLATNRNFVRTGDGLIEIPGHPPLPAWYGWRWKQAIQ